MTQGPLLTTLTISPGSPMGPGGPVGPAGPVRPCQGNICSSQTNIHAQRHIVVSMKH